MSSWGKKTLSTGLLLFLRAEGAVSVSCLFPEFQHLTGSLWYSWACISRKLVSAFNFIRCSPCLCICLYIYTFPLYMNTKQVALSFYSNDLIWICWRGGGEAIAK